MISIYSTILCAVSRKKQVTTASHAAGTTDSIAKNVKIALLHHTCLKPKCDRTGVRNKRCKHQTSAWN